jgi:ABC-2 type transport system ATP-binding protein
MPAIHADNLTKSFRVRRSAGGEGWRLSRWLRPPPVIEVPAVSHLSFSIEPGERVAFIGPNGAGKSTSLKMLTGMLLPSAGHAEVAGLVPWQERRKLARHIGIVFGQRSQLWWQLPVRASFDLLGQIYGVERGRPDAGQQSAVLHHLRDLFQKFLQPQGLGARGSRPLGGVYLLGIRLGRVSDRRYP